MSEQERLAAHERLSTGALARWMRACANHTWRVVIAWLAITAGLIVLVVTDQLRQAPTPRSRALRP